MNRRRYLQMLAGTGALAGLAGCNDSTESDRSSPTVVFTDESTASSETRTTTSETPSSTPTPEPTATATATPTPTETVTAENRVFDGGDLESFVDAITTVAEIGGGTVAVEPGTYRFEPLQVGKANRHAVLQSVENVTIEGSGATFVLTNPSIGGFRFVGGSDVMIRDLVLDYDPVPFTQGRLETVSSADGTLTLTLDERYPTLDHSMFQRADSVYAMVHEPDGQFFSGVQANGPTEKYFSNIEHIGGRTYRLSLDNNSNSRGLAEGRRLTVVARNNSTVLSMYKTENPTFENVTIRTSSGGDFSVQVCESPTFRDCTVAPPPNSDRQLSSVADGIRITNCLERSTVENCYHDSLGDDSIAVDYRMTTIIEFQSDRMVGVKEIHPFVVKAGDSLEALSPTGVRKTDLPPVESVQGQSASVGGRAKPITITFEEPVRGTLAEGDFLGNTATNSENYSIRNNEFRNHRAKLIRASSGGGVIENNILVGTSLSTIELHSGTSGYWPPKGGIRDVTVQNNTIRRPGLGLLAGYAPFGIFVHHEAPGGNSTESRPNENITIVNNDIETSAAAGIELSDAKDVIIERNNLHDLNRLDYSNSGFGFRLSNLSGVTLSENTVTGTSEALSGFGFRTDSEELSLSDNELRIDGERPSVRLLQWKPVTLEISRTVTVGDRPLAFSCSGLRLLNAADDVIREVSVGGTEDGVFFGEGVDGREQADDKTWRWLGPEDKISELKFFDTELADATTLEMRGYPIEEGISATVRVDGETTDQISWDTNQTKTYRLSISDT